MKDMIIAANGSIQEFEEIPEDIRDLYRTAWEIKQKSIVEMAADRGAFICQSQSMNIYMQDANFGKLTSMHFYAWEKGLKTGMYYLRTKSAADAIKFTVDAEMMRDRKEKEKGKELELVKAQGQDAIACSLDDPEGCVMCSG
jgi:ribonucleoside-diphosphate reductase alpha chain